MANQTREDLRKRIAKSSKDKVILEEMIRLGYWPTNEEGPTVPEQVITEQAELRKKLSQLIAQKTRLGNKEALLKEIRSKRLKESREKQKANKEKKAKEQLKRIQKWNERKSNEILYLGEDVSKTLNKYESDIQRLNYYQLPTIKDAKELSDKINLTVNELRYLAFNRKVSRTTHYKRFYIPKKNGDKRLISAPMPRLKHVQYWILQNILEKIQLTNYAHGFVKTRSIVTNASVHTDKDIVINIDLKDFFPNISYKRIKGIFHSFGYSENIATILALLCTESDVDEIQMDGIDYYVAKGERFLPQGAPTSPALTNIITRKLDKRLQGAATKNGFMFTRYADDLTFSCTSESSQNLTKLMWHIKKIIEDEGFFVHPKKIRIMRKGRRQEVTGITVNKKISLDRKTLKRFRALLHQIELNGPEGKTWGKGENILNSIKGYSNFIKMVDPQKAEKYIKKVNQIHEKYKHQPYTSQNQDSHINNNTDQSLISSPPPELDESKTQGQKKNQEIETTQEKQNSEKKIINPSISIIPKLQAEQTYLQIQQTLNRAQAEREAQPNQTQDFNTSPEQAQAQQYQYTPPQDPSMQNQGNQNMQGDPGTTNDTLKTTLIIISIVIVGTMILCFMCMVFVLLLPE